jgi:hypothetical protein
VERSEAVSSLFIRPEIASALPRLAPFDWLRAPRNTE